jgi:GT2 family glycosyltransferase
MDDVSQAPTDLSTTVAVVVHYRSYGTVAETVANLIEQGLTNENILVVDNSEQPELRPTLQSTMPPGVRVDFVQNSGYAAAVNWGMDHFDRVRTSAPTFLVVATHETTMRPSAVSRLVDALLADTRAAVAGPTLISGEHGEEYVWSKGGFLSKIAHFPKHFGHRERFSAEMLASKSPETRSWLDGAFLTYRWSDVVNDRLSEDFFLYMEETDLHLRLGRQGKRILWVPDSVVWQSSGGIPPYYLARNTRLLFRRNEAPWRRAFIPIAIAKRIAADLTKRRNIQSIVPSIKGLLERIEATRSSKESPYVSVVNPLGGALARYERELLDNLTAGGVEYEVFSTLEPSVGHKSRARWVRDYLSVLSEAARSAGRRHNGRVLVVWPVLGYFDVLILALYSKRAWIVMHDPRPLVRAIGYGKLPLTVARIFRGRVGLIVHSERAAAVVRNDAPSMKLTTLAHPILAPESSLFSAPSPPTVQVFGQFKPDRDVNALLEIARKLEGRASFTIDGRGWPNIAGWTVVNRFVPEDEVDQLIDRSSVVVIPYKSFFQSGVAIRCLERGVPFVGPGDSSLADLLGDGSEWLTRKDSVGSWPDAVLTAMLSDRTPATLAGRAWRNRSISEWREWAGA